MASTTIEVNRSNRSSASSRILTKWKRQHTTKIIVKETGEKVTKIKYKWTTSGANEADISEFTDIRNFIYINYNSK